MYVKIYQTNNPEVMVKTMMGEEPTAADMFNHYPCIWKGEVDAEDLDDVFRIFNLEHPANYTGRSLSVGDIVQVGIDGPKFDNFYLVCIVGFKRLF